MHTRGAAAASSSSSSSDAHTRPSKLANALFERGSAHQRLVDSVPDVLEAITQTAVSLECDAAYDDEAARTVNEAIAAIMQHQHRAEHQAAGVNALASSVAQMHGGELESPDFDWDARIAHFVKQASERAADADRAADRAALRDVRERVWEVAHPGEPMPDDAQDDAGDDDDDDDDELQVSGGTFTSTCPILQTPMLDAVRNTLCKHVYSRQGAMQLIEQGAGAAKCPHVGCHANLRAANLRRDLPTIDRVRQQLRRRAQHRHHAAAAAAAANDADDSRQGGDDADMLDFTQPSNDDSNGG